MQEFAGGGIFDDVIQLGADGILRLPDLAAQVLQRHAGGIRHFFRGKDAVGDLPFQHRLGRQRIEQIVGRQHFMFAQAVPLGQAGKIAQRGGDFQQLPHRKDAAFLRMGGDAAHFPHAAETRAAVFDQQRIDGVGLRQRVPFFLRRRAGFQGLHADLCFLAGAELYRPRNDLIQFQCGFVGCIHTGYRFSSFQYSF